MPKKRRNEVPVFQVKNMIEYFVLVFKDFKTGKRTGLILKDDYIKMVME